MTHAAAALVVQQLIDITYPPAHSSKHAARCSSGRMGQTDGQTLYRYIDPALHIMRAVPVTTVQSETFELFSWLLR